MAPDMSEENGSLVEYISPIWSNIYWARKALGIYDAISEHANDINKTDNKYFFYLVQNLALDAATITICKIFETGNRQHIKHTIPELCTLLERKLLPTQVTWESLSELGMEESASKSFVNLLNQNSQTMRELMTILRSLIPSCQNNAAFKKIFKYRNKIAAHQECLNEVKKTSARQLPSYEDMERIISWAEKFCVFVGRSLLGGNPFVAPCTSAKTATLNVIATALKKDFKSDTDYLSFLRGKTP